MGVTVVSASGRVFAGMVYTHSDPCEVSAEYLDHVMLVSLLDIPSVLREYACTFLDGEAADGTWWTVGEFRYAGEDYQTAFARCVDRNGRVSVEYGLESDD